MSVHTHTYITERIQRYGWYITHAYKLVHAQISPDTTHTNTCTHVRPYIQASLCVYICNAYTRLCTYIYIYSIYASIYICIYI